MSTALRATFAAAVRMIDRVHRRAAHERPPAFPAVAAGLADLNVHVIGVAHRADRGPARRRYAANFSAGQINLRPVRFAGNERGARSGRAAQSPAATWLQL